jgi:hypothetical protein
MTIRSLCCFVLLLASCGGVSADGARDEISQTESELGFGIPPAKICDKVTTYVCPGNDCLCKQKDCEAFWHNGEYAPCSGPPAPGCEHDHAVQLCYPQGQAIDCSSNGVPVGGCGLFCNDAGVQYSMEGRCCRGERTCTPSPIWGEPIQGELEPRSIGCERQE